MTDLPELHNGMTDMKPRFAVGQVWTDIRGRTRQIIVAITENETWPIVTQDKDGDVSCYSANGRWLGDDPRDRPFDLVTLIAAPADTAEFVRNHGQEVA